MSSRTVYRICRYVGPSIDYVYWIGEFGAWGPEWHWNKRYVSHKRIAA